MLALFRRYNCRTCLWIPKLPKPMFSYLRSNIFSLPLLLLIAVGLSACDRGPDCPEFEEGQLWVDTNNGRITERVNALYVYQEETDTDVLQMQMINEGSFSFALSLLAEGENSLSLGRYALDTLGRVGSLSAQAVVNGEDAYFAEAGDARITFLDWECREVSAFFDLKLVNYENSADTLALSGALQGALMLIQDETE